MAYLDNVYAVVQIAPTGIPTYVRLSQNENGRILHFAISGDALPAGSTVVLTGTKPDGAVYSVSGTLANNVATFNEDGQLTAVAGEWDAKVEVTKSGNLIATGRIKFVIDADPSGGNIPSDSQLDGYIAEMLSLLDAGRAEAYGSPLVASTVAGMIDQSRVYVYTGSETGYTAGNWYYWNGSAWTSGGVYNSVAINTDTTLSVAGMAADAKATGGTLNGLDTRLGAAEEDITELRDDLSNIVDYNQSEQITENSDFITFAGNYYQGADGTLNESANYKMYKYTAVNDFDFWFPTDYSAMDCIVAVYTAEPIQHSTFVSPRYRTDNNTVPLVDSKASISAGQVLTVATYNNHQFTILTSEIDTASYLQDSILFTETRYNEIKNRIDIPVTVTVAPNKYTFNLANDYETALVKIENVSERANLWNFNGLRKGLVNIFGAGTDIIGVLKETGEDDFMGGVHGDETVTEFLIFGDGEAITEFGMFQRVDIFMNSHLTRVSTGENIIDRVVHITILNNEIKIDNTFICLVNNFSLNYAYNGGMWAWFKNVADSVYTSYGVVDASTATGDYGMSKDFSKVAVMLTDGSYFEIENIVGKDYANFEGEIYTYSGEANPRQKIYFATDHGSTWNAGHRCYGQFVYRLIA